MAAMAAVGSLGSNLGHVVEGSAPDERYQRLLAMRRESRDPLVTDDVHSLVVSAVSHTYKSKDDPALVGLDLRIDQASIVALVGVNGAGKTAAVNSIVGTLDPQQGSPRIARRHPTGAPPTTLVARASG